MASVYSHGMVLLVGIAVILTEPTAGSKVFQRKWKPAKTASRNSAAVFRDNPHKSSIARDDPSSTDSGLSIQISQKALGYMANKIADSLPEFFENLTIPDSSGAAYTISDLKLQKMAKPTIEATFVQGVGIKTTIVMPKAEARGAYDAGIGWFSSRGKFIGQIANLNATVVISLETDNVTSLPTVQLRQCNVTIQSTNIIFYGGGAGSAVASTLKSVIREIVDAQVNYVVCQSATESAKFYENQVVEDVQERQGVCDEFGGSSGNDGGTMGLPLPAAAPIPPDITARLKKVSVNVTMNKEPIFLDHSGILFLDGTFLYDSYRPRQFTPISRNIALDKPAQMIRVFISENVPNSFFRHVYEQRLVKVHEKLSVQNLPRELRTPFAFVCPRCELHIHAEASSAPKIRITPAGIFLKIEGLIQSNVQGIFSNLNLFSGVLRMTVRIRPYMRANRLRGEVHLDNVEVTLSHKGVGFILNLFAEEIAKALKEVWPPLKKQLQHITGVEGIQLPVICGAELVDSAISLAEGAVVVDSDVSYTSHNLVEKMKIILGV